LSTDVKTQIGRFVWHENHSKNVERTKSFYTELLGWEIEGWLYRPPLAAEAPPLVLHVHGGPYGAWGHSFYFQAQVLAGLGYASLYVNPRGSLGWGERFTRANVKDLGHGDLRDRCRAAALLAQYVAHAHPHAAGYLGPGQQAAARDQTVEPAGAESAGGRAGQGFGHGPAQRAPQGLGRSPQ